MDIAIKYKVSVHKVVYWMSKHSIPRRTWSEATYIKKHPNGDPFKFIPPSTPETIKLFGIGLDFIGAKAPKQTKLQLG